MYALKTGDRLTLIVANVCHHTSRGARALGPTHTTAVGAKYAGWSGALARVCPGVCQPLYALKTGDRLTCIVANVCHHTSRGARALGPTHTTAVGAKYAGWSGALARVCPGVCQPIYALKTGERLTLIVADVCHPTSPTLQTPNCAN